jgi:hypothetical protein
MAFTYLLSTAVGQVRLLIPDNNPTNFIFSDEEITGLLAMEGSRVKRGAALALETIGSSQTLVLKAITLLDLTTDGPKVSAELRARAKVLREQDAADLVLEDVTGDASGFEIAEWYLGPASHRDYIDRHYRGYE